MTPRTEPNTSDILRPTQKYGCARQRNWILCGWTVQDLEAALGNGFDVTFSDFFVYFCTVWNFCNMYIFCLKIELKLCFVHVQAQASLDIRRLGEPQRQECVCVCARMCACAHVHACMKDQETSWEEIRKQIIEVYSTLILKILLLLIIF